jgi:hypothetical protein
MRIDLHMYQVHATLMTSRGGLACEYFATVESLASSQLLHLALTMPNWQSIQFSQRKGTFSHGRNEHLFV